MTTKSAMPGPPAVSRQEGAWLPSLSRGIVDCLIFTAVFAVAARVSLGTSLEPVLLPLPLVVAILFACMLLSGVYRSSVQANNLWMLLRTSLAFGAAAIVVLPLLHALLPQTNASRFAFFFLFLAFCVTNTLQPLIAAGEQRRASFLANRQAKAESAGK